MIAGKPHRFAFRLFREARRAATTPRHEYGAGFRPAPFFVYSVVYSGETG